MALSRTLVEKILETERGRPFAVLAATSSPGLAAALGELVGPLVESDPFTLSLASSLGEAERLAAEAGCNLALLDVALGETAILRWLRRSAHLAGNPPTVLLTSPEEEELTVRGLLAGAADFLFKTTLSAELLLRSMHYSLERRRLETLGLSTGGLVHDLNNLLSSVLGHAELLERRLEAGTDAAASAQEVRRAALGARTLVLQLLDFGRQRQAGREPLELGEVVRELMRSLRPLLGSAIELEARLCRRPLPVDIERADLERVITNVILNARDAMPLGGRILLLTDGPAPAVAPGFARLEIRDRGVGMDEETRARVFEPFFTTKSRGAGTGLGLSTVAEIVRRRAGRVVVESAPGRGTTVRIDLPLRSRTE